MDKGALDSSILFWKQEVCLPLQETQHSVRILFLINKKMKNRLFVFFTCGETQSHPTGNLGISGITAWAPSCEHPAIALQEQTVEWRGRDSDPESRDTVEGQSRCPVGGVGASRQPKHQVPLSAALPTPQGKSFLGALWDQELLLVSPSEHLSL